MIQARVGISNTGIMTTQLHTITLRWLTLLRLLRMARRAFVLKRPMLLKKWLLEERHTILSRIYFSLGDFHRARIRAAAHLRLRPNDHQIRVVALCCAIELGEFQCAERHLSSIDEQQVSEEFTRQRPFFRYAIAKRDKRERTRLAIKHLDKTFLDMGCRRVFVASIPKTGVFDALSPAGEIPSNNATEHRPLSRGALVSVVMTAFNSAHLVTTAVRSILDQSYQCLELIVVDDCSTDATLRVLRELAKSDPRMRVIAKNTNDGTYVSKNIGIAEARGKYVALQDSDDWSHPERIGKSIALLEARPDVVAMTTEWARMTTNGRLAIQSTTKCTYRACISLVFRKLEVLSSAGYFDSVRAEGDAEYIERLRIIFGQKCVIELPWPLSFGRIRSQALTANRKLGMVRGRARPARGKYRRAYKRWHSSISTGCDAYVAFPLERRPFPAPTALLPRRHESRWIG